MDDLFPLWFVIFMALLAILLGWWSIVLGSAILLGVGWCLVKWLRAPPSTVWASWQEEIKHRNSLK